MTRARSHDKIRKTVHIKKRLRKSIKRHFGGNIGYIQSNYFNPTSELMSNISTVLLGPSGKGNKEYFTNESKAKMIAIIGFISALLYCGNALEDKIMKLG